MSDHKPGDQHAGAAGKRVDDEIDQTRVPPRHQKLKHLHDGGECRKPDRRDQANAISEAKAESTECKNGEMLEIVGRSRYGPQGGGTNDNTRMSAIRIHVSARNSLSSIGPPPFDKFD